MPFINASEPHACSCREGSPRRRSPATRIRSAPGAAPPEPARGADTCSRSPRLTRVDPRGRTPFAGFIGHKTRSCAQIQRNRPQIDGILPGRRDGEEPRFLLNQAGFSALQALPTTRLPCRRSWVRVPSSASLIALLRRGFSCRQIRRNPYTRDTSTIARGAIPANQPNGAPIRRFREGADGVAIRSYTGASALASS